jgi:hypothetical protein
VEAPPNYQQNNLIVLQPIARFLFVGAENQMGLRF